MKLERSNVDFPLWRKKVDASMFRYNGTTIPNWACNVWRISDNFSKCNSKKTVSSNVKIVFQNKTFEGWVTIAPKGRKNPAYRLWWSKLLTHELKDSFLMSFVRNIEDKLRKSKYEQKKSKGIKKTNIEEEIPFWEFLDIEYDIERKIFHLAAYYTQKPTFSELFKQLIESPILHDIDDKLSGKESNKIYKNKWKPRSKLELEIGAENVVYTLIDTKNKLIYVGEASNLVNRLKQGYASIPDWDYFRYNRLPNELEQHRVHIERMTIRDYASLLENKKKIKAIKISDYKLANDKIDNK